MQDKKESEDLKDRLAYEPEEVKRMVEEYNRQKQIEFEDLHSEKTCKIISVFNVFQNILLIAWLISFIISIVELYMHYPLTNHSIRFGRDRRILTPIIMPVAVMMGEYIGGLSKIGGTVFTHWVVPLRFGSQRNIYCYIRICRFQHGLQHFLL